MLKFAAFTPKMIIIEKTIISQDFIGSCFSCDLSACSGACCVLGDSGAPLEKHEVRLLKKIYRQIKPFLRKEGIEAIETIGTSTTDIEKDTVTPLINGRECAYVVFENNIAFCGIEKAFLHGAIKFRKPASCHLYPVRIRNLKDYDAVNYDRWDICEAAIVKGGEEKMPLYLFTREALTIKYGHEWFNLLETAIKSLERESSEKK